MPFTRYSLPLVVDRTEINNKTTIRCADQSLEYETSLFTYYHSQLTLNLDDTAADMTEQAVNISWRPASPVPIAMQMFSLTISLSNGNKIVNENMTEQYYYFSQTDSKNAPPCEVYDFSITATPVGATYTGDGCSVASGQLTGMLPSLPDIAPLESSLNYTLAIGFGNGFQLKVFFMPASFCADYPVTDYVLEVEGPTTSSMSITPGSISTVDNLLENEMYSFHIIVSNSVGNVSTNKTAIYTTDVQMVTAVLTEDNSYTVQCVFVTGSTARGCMVVLVGQSDNTRVHLTREGLCATGTANTKLAQATCITKVIGYDIESDGTVGTLAIEGVLSNNTLTCLPVNYTQSLNFGIVIGIPLALGIMVMVIFMIILILLVVSRVQSKPSNIEMKPNEVYGVATDSIKTQRNEVYGVVTDNIETQPNVVYGVNPSDTVVTAPNEVYSMSLK